MALLLQGEAVGLIPPAPRHFAFLLGTGDWALTDAMLINCSHILSTHNNNNNNNLKNRRRVRSGPHSSRRRRTSCSRALP